MATYQEIRRQVENLTPDEQLRLLEELAALVRRRITPKHKRSIMELEGLGKEIWQDIDAQEYVNRERDSWNG
ncbi:MAG: hypothetical protein KME46_12425 [Brasilonema angustatum HA4187-MV1]|jgi:hypothetical protein|nr:hypothetical protein [Brasilonema angustatum HA4187-MV1]